MTENVIDSRALFMERSKLHSDIYSNIIPKRLPVSASISFQTIAEYNGLNLIDFQYDSTKLIPYLDRICNEFYSDTLPFFPPTLSQRPAIPYQLIGSQAFVMGETGFVQHPEVVGMLDTEYDELIERPFDFLVETVIPRQHKDLDPSNPLKMAYRLQMMKNALSNDMTIFMPTLMQLSQKYGYYLGSPMGSTAFSIAPFDFLADLLRSFSGISIDVRRNRNKVKEAVDVLMPLMYQWGLPALVHPEGASMFLLHMPTFMREKDFVELWLPSMKKIMEQYAARGIRSAVFCESNWSGLLDIVKSEFPAGTRVMFEYGDPQTIKDKLGKKFILGRMFPLSIVKNGSKQQVIDEVKKFLDIMMPGGGYTFGFDKNPLMLCDINLDNYKELLDFMHEYAIYPNSGQSYGTPLNSEKFSIDTSLDKQIKSDYIFDWKEFKKSYPIIPDFAEQKFNTLSKGVFDFYMQLLI